MANFSRLAPRRASAVEHLRVAVPLHDLRRDGRRLEAQAAAHGLLDLGREVREGPDGARQLADGGRLARPFHALSAPNGLRVPVSELQAEGHRLGVDAVGAPDHRGVLVGERALAEHRQEGVEVVQDDSASFPDQKGKGRVDDVRRRQAVVEPAAFRPDALGHVRHEGDDVVLDLLLDGVDPRDVEAGPALDCFQSLPRHDAPLREHLRGGDLDAEPGCESVLVGPDVRHLGMAVARNHGTPSWSEGVGGPGGDRPREKSIIVD